MTKLVLKMTPIGRASLCTLVASPRLRMGETLRLALQRASHLRLPKTCL